MLSSPVTKKNLDTIQSSYYSKPDPQKLEQAVAFGTSGHRGSSLNKSFTEAHILAITQSVCNYRKQKGITGPLYIGKDTHALSAPALETALEVLAANGVETYIQSNDLPTPTPVISQAIIAHNSNSKKSIADGIVITPSHNPPEDGGFKYNEPHGGPAGTEITTWIEKHANALLAEGNKEIKRLASPRKADCIHEIDFIMPYVQALKEVINLEAISSSGLQLGVDPLGGASLPFWQPIAEMYRININIVNKTIDPLFSFMPPDHDGVIRMDCSSPYAMAGLIKLADQYDLAFGNDPDADRHGIVTPEGLMPPNNYLSAAIWYLLRHRPKWPKLAKVGKTTVSTGLIDKICVAAGRAAYETPVGFKWFVAGLISGELVFGGEESAGASFLRLDGRPWTTDKDGLILNLLAAEMTAVTGKNPAQIYTDLTNEFGKPYYARLDAPANSAQKKALKALSPSAITQKYLAGSPITNVLTNAPGDNEPLGGLKVITEKGWFAARPSGTEDIYKIYAESFESEAHLKELQQDAQALVAKAFE